MTQRARHSTARPVVHAAETDRWLVALDIDGTVMREDGVITEPTLAAIGDAVAAGHEVMLATGRSPGMVLPLLDQIDIRPRFLVCGNGALTLERDDSHANGYRRVHVETFDPTEVLQTVRGALERAAFGVEDEEGRYRLAGPFPDQALNAGGTHVEFEDLLGVEATRVVVISPGYDLEEFLQVVESMGLHEVSYTVGWTAWLDIAPNGVTKAVAMERVREWLNIPRDRVLAAGDGRNDIDMLRWAAAEGRGVAMGQAPDDVVTAGNEHVGSVTEDGLVAALASLPH